jgi:hypothetical protein
MIKVLAAVGCLAQRVFLALDRMEHKLDVLIKLLQAKEDKQHTPLDQLAFDRFCPVCFQKITYAPTVEGPVGVTVRSCGCTSKSPQVVIREGEE